MLRITLPILLLLTGFAATTVAAPFSCAYAPNQIPLRVDAADVPIGFLSVTGTESLHHLDLEIAGQTQIIDVIKLYPVGPKDTRPGKDVPVLASIRHPGGRVRLSPAAPSHSQRFALTVTLKPNADLLARFTVAYRGAHFDAATVQAPATSPAITYRPAIKVRDRGDDGSKGYRIPGLVTTNAGTLLACYDVRYDGMRDLQGHMDIGISRSTNAGRSWEPMRIALDQGTYGNLPELYNGVSDANLLVDQKSGRIFCFGLWMHGVNDKSGKWQGAKGWIHQWHNGGSNPGFEIKGTSQFLVSYSDDDGKSWSKAENLTRTVKREAAWQLFAPAPGNGITLRDGTLVVPTQGKDAKNRPFSTITYSRDRGKTWRTGRPANDGAAGRLANECAVVELPDGSLMLNARDPGRNKYRRVFLTSDLGETWTRHAASHQALVEPTCMASLIAIPHNDAQLLLFSNPNTKTSRTHMTIKASLDQGNSWPTQHQLLLDQRGGAYSALSPIDSTTVGIFYESSQAMLLFQRLAISEILGADVPPAPPQ